jgi:16S rRNA (cytosine1402-N4)-methyltransferase
VGEPGPEETPHRRRPRYRGTHPRRFEEKYKELAPELHPEFAEHVRRRGQTPAGQHVPILTDELLSVLAPAPGQRGVDGTLGWGGHAQRVLEHLVPGGQLLALDVDPVEGPKTEARLRALGHDEGTLLVRRRNFAGLRALLHEVGWPEGADFVYVDLGLSSMQIDDPQRGFSFQHAGPLDMRMNPGRGPSAAQWLERVSEGDLARALRDNADEPRALDLARALFEQRAALQTTAALAGAVRGALPPHVAEEDADLSVRRVFQAVRIEVNDELGALDAWLRQLPLCLRPGGRAAALTFHSGEDRRVKGAFREGLRAGLYAAVSDAVIRPSAAERRSNPRSKPAKLRWARRA